METSSITGLTPLSRIATHFCVKDSGGSRFEKREFPLSHDEALHSVSACVHVNSHSGKRSLLVAMESPLDAGLSHICQPSRKFPENRCHREYSIPVDLKSPSIYYTIIPAYIYTQRRLRTISNCITCAITPPQHAESALAIPAGTGLSYSDQTLDRSPDLLKNLGTSRVLCLCLRSVLLSLESLFSRHFS